MTAAQGIIRPEKPYPEFPLYAHGSGVWAKKFRGTTYYLGPWVDHEGALAEWHRIRDEIELGIVSSAVTGRVDVDYMVNAFLASKKAQVDAGDLRLCTFQQYKLACKWLKENMGAHRVIENVGPADFMRLISKFDPKWSATTIKNQVNLVRTIFKWAYENDLIDKPVKYGTNFSRPSAKRRNLEKASKPPKDFAASEIWTLLDASSMRLRAWLLLGLNCGYGNSDLSRLKVSDVSGEWLREARGKTGLDRKAWLWPETARGTPRSAEGSQRRRPDVYDAVRPVSCFRRRHSRCRCLRVRQAQTVLWHPPQRSRLLLDQTCVSDSW